MKRVSALKAIMKERKKDKGRKKLQGRRYSMSNIYEIEISFAIVK